MSIVTANLPSDADEAVIQEAVKEAVIQNAVKEAVIEDAVKETLIGEEVKDVLIQKALKETPVEETLIQEAVREAVIEGAVKEAVIGESVKEAVIEEAVKEAVFEEAVKEAVIDEAVKEAVIEEAVKEAVIEEAVKEAVIEEAVKEAVIEEAVKEAVIEEAVKEAVIEEAIEEEAGVAVVELGHHKMEELSPYQKSTEVLIEASEEHLPTLEEGSKLKPILCALSVCFGSFVFGTVIGWPSPALPDLNDHRNPFHTTSEQTSWIGSVITLGALLGGLCGGWYMDFFGRKMGLLYSAFPFAAGWTIIASSPTFSCMMVGRALTGLCTGIFSVICPVYISEISPPSIRGLLGSCHQMAICIGILFTYGFGTFLNWSWLAIACEVVIILLVLTVAFIPESPRWLLSINKREEAESSLKWLRGDNVNVTHEIMQLDAAIKASQDQASVAEFLQPQLWKPLLISVGLMVFQQWSGINVIMFYTVQIFQMAHIDLDPNIQTIIVGAVGIVGTLVSVFISDLVGRKILLLISAFLMALSIGGMGAFFYELDVANEAYATDSLSWLPVTCLVVFNFGFDVAFGPIPWLMMSELFPLRAKAIATSVATTLNWLFAFLTTKYFTAMTEGIGTYGAYWVFTGFCVLAIPFIIFFVPETKGIPLEEIERRFVKVKSK